MTDAQDSKKIILKEWDKSVEALGRAKTVGEIATALVFMFEALKPLIERSTVTDEELQQHADNCPALSIIKGNARPALVAFINQFPWLGIFTIIGVVLYQIIKHFNGALP